MRYFKKSNIIYLFIITFMFIIPDQIQSSDKSCLGALLSVVDNSPKIELLELTHSNFNMRLSEGQFFSINEKSFTNENFQNLLKKNISSNFAYKIKDIDQLLQISKKQIDNAKIFFSYPVDVDGYKNIFGEELSKELHQASTKQILKTEKVIKDVKLDGLIVLNKSIKKKVSHSSQVIDFIESNNNIDSVVIFAHNKDGILKFADGSSIRIEDLSKLCYNNNKSPIILSCNTIKNYDKIESGFLTNNKLYFEDFAKSLLKVSVKYEKDESVSMTEFIKIADETFIIERKKVKLKARVVVYTVPTSSGLVFCGGIVSINYGLTNREN